MNVPDRRKEFLDKKVVRVEWRYCHLGSEIGDFFLTTLNRTLTWDAKAAHHHFLILYLQDGGMVYVDKHWDRNIRRTGDTNGRNKDGESVSSDVKTSCSSRRVTVGEVVDFCSQERFARYVLRESDCQDFAEDVYNWLTL